jgi:PAS domain S-box-containing protein
VEQFLRRQTAFAELTQHALAGTDLDSLMGEAVSLVAEALSLEYCKVLELQPDGKNLLLRAGIGWKEGYVGQATVGTNTGSQAGYTLASHSPVIVEDFKTETRFNAPPLLKEHHVVSGLSVIIGELQRPYGVLGAHTVEQRRFTQDDVNLLRLVANVLAALIQRKRAEETVQQSRARLSGIIESAMDAIITLDAEHRIVIFNRSAEQMFGCSANEAIGQRLDRFIPKRYRESHGEYIRSFGETGVTTRAMAAARSVYALRSNGEEFPIEASISQSGKRGQWVYTVIIRDITERKRAEERIREQAAFLDEAQEAIMVRNLENRILYWNHGAERLYGWTAEEVLGEDIRHLHYRSEPQQLDQITESVVINGIWKGETRQVNRQGKELVIDSRMTLIRDDRGKPKSILAINTDITEKKKLEAQFLRAQRMENIGLLSGGIVHDLNNLLTPITVGVSLLRPHLSSEDDQHTLSIINVNAQRGAELMKQLLSFARGADENRIMLQARHLIKELVATLRETFPKNIDIQFLAPADLSLVVANATQLYQALMNLTLNARDAMPSGGLLKIAAENVEFDEKRALIKSEAQPGHHVLITVEDTGVGISADMLDRIFDPFFTTKEAGKGTGLGLSTTFGIVKNHGGFMDFSSVPGGGSQFKIYLPALGSHTPAPLTPPDHCSYRGDGKMVLVVDDETGIREVAARALEARGYKTLSAKDGTEALAAYVGHKEQVKAVVMDMMMPHMNGLQTIRALKKLNPQLKVITTSGGPYDETRQIESARLEVNAFLPKPFDTESLLEKLSEVLSD